MKLAELCIVIYRVTVIMFFTPKLRWAL